MTRKQKSSGKREVATKERGQGAVKGTGVNKPVEKPAQHTFRTGAVYTRPTQRQKV
jgi:hypothetical protein